VCCFVCFTCAELVYKNKFSQNKVVFFCLFFLQFESNRQLLHLNFKIKEEYNESDIQIEKERDR